MRRPKMPLADITDQQRRFLTIAHERLGGWSLVEDQSILEPLVRRGFLEYVKDPITRRLMPRITPAGCAVIGQTEWLL